MNKELDDMLSDESKNKIVISGLEGCGKSLSIIEWYMTNTEFNKNEMFIYACKSYNMLKEKRNEILNNYNLLEREVIIVGTPSSLIEYSDFITNKEHPSRIFPETRLVLCTHQFINKCCHISMQMNEDDAKRKTIKAIIMDEFDYNSGIIPSLDYLFQTYGKKCATDKSFLEDVDFFDNSEKITKKVIKKSFLDFLDDNFSKEDRRRAETLNYDLDNKKFFIASWILFNSMFKSKTIFCTSEILARTLLVEIGFTPFDFDVEDNIFKEDIVNLYPAKVTSDVLYRIDKGNKWGIFGIPTIISDKCTYASKMRCFTHSNIEVNVVNHSNVRGSNNLSGVDILTIISYIPKDYIKFITDTLNSFKKYEAYKTEDVEVTYYLDRIRQAVGRSIGYRGVWKNKHETYLIINNHLYEKLQETLNKNSTLFPYSIKEWNYNNKELDLIINQSIDYRKSIEEDKQYESKIVIKNKIHELFELSNSSKVTYEEIKNIIDKKIRIIKNIKPSAILKEFNLTKSTSSKLINGKTVTFNLVRGLKIKDCIK